MHYIVGLYIKKWNRKKKKSNQRGKEFRNADADRYYEYNKTKV